MTILTLMGEGVQMEDRDNHFSLVLLAFLFKSTFSEQHTNLNKCG